MQFKVIEETQEICSLCGGRGTEGPYHGHTSSTTAGTSANYYLTCRQCQGVGYLITKRVLRAIEPDDRFCFFDGNLRPCPHHDSV